MKLLISFLLAMVFCAPVIAQPMLGPGCKVGNRVYQVNIGTYLFWPLYQGFGGVQYSEWTVQYDQTTYPCINWVNQNSTCVVRLSTGLIPNDVSGLGGYFAPKTTSVCVPLDDHLWALVIPGLAIGVRKIYNGKRFQT